MENEADSQMPDVVEAIHISGLTIYDDLGKCPELYLESEVLESLLRFGLIGMNLDYPLRTRSKVLKTKVCEILGYPVPASFKKTQPRFLGQNFDTYIQKSNNLQIWNEEIVPSRRYVIIRVNNDSIVSGLRVVDGEILATFDKTGTLTHKYQAKSRLEVVKSILCSKHDTDNVRSKLLRSSSRSEKKNSKKRTGSYPSKPQMGDFHPINEIFNKLSGLLGEIIDDPGLDQERNRGGSLHKRICSSLNWTFSKDTGQFPDITHQLLEVKLQCSPTIDLGLVSPDNTSRLASVPEFRHCDVRYAVFYGEPVSKGIQLNHLIVTTGELFFSFFQRFEGKVLNKKLQMPLPDDFFS